MRRVSMSKIKDVLRLKYLNQLSNRQVQTMTGVSRNSVANYIKSYIELDSPLDEVLTLSDNELEELFVKNTPKVKTVKKVAIEHPDWNEVRIELARKGMTRLLLWEELKEKNPNLYGHSQFNRYYAAYLKKTQSIYETSTLQRR